MQKIIRLKNGTYHKQTDTAPLSLKLCHQGFTIPGLYYSDLKSDVIASHGLQIRNDKRLPVTLSNTPLDPLSRGEVTTISFSVTGDLKSLVCIIRI